MDGQTVAVLSSEAADELLRMLGENRAVLLEGGTVEFVTRHLAAGAPVVVVVLGAEVPAEPRTARLSANSEYGGKEKGFYSSFTISIRGLKVALGHAFNECTILSPVRIDRRTSVQEFFRSFQSVEYD